MSKNINSILDEVRKDYEARCEARNAFDSIWQLNANFVKGNQYSHIGCDDKVTDTDKEYCWQEREVFNHVAPIIETRLAKLSRVRPHLTVRPLSSHDADIRTSKAGTEFLTSIRERLDELITKGTDLSEMYGSVFYKVFRGYKDGKPTIEVCPPQEIYPDKINCIGVEECSSIIHAKRMTTTDIVKKYGTASKLDKNTEHLVIERYTAPCKSIRMVSL